MSDQHRPNKLDTDKLGKTAVKFAQDTAYAVAGLADILAGTIREVFADQRKQLADKKAAGQQTDAKAFVGAVPQQVKGLVDEMTTAYKDLASRGRTALKHGFAATGHRADTPDPVATDPGDVVHPPADPGVAESAPADETVDMPVDTEPHAESSLLDDGPATEDSDSTPESKSW